jgi:hypothetical protein
MRCLITSALLVACGGKLAPEPAANDAGLFVEASAVAISSEGSDAASDSPAALSDAQEAGLPEAQAPCESENAPQFTAEQYAAWLCQAMFVCAGGSGDTTIGTTGTPGVGCADIILLRASGELSNPACLNACALFLQSIQQGGPGCRALLQGGPAQCEQAFQSPVGFIYCSGGGGRVNSDEAHDGVWCPSDEQCVTGFSSPWNCPSTSQTDGLAAASCPQTAWVCLD